MLLKWGSTIVIFHCRKYLHDVSANERDANHEQPARNNREDPEDVSKGNGEAKFGELPIEWVKVALIGSLLLP